MGIAETAIASMRSPKDMHIICIDVTNKCDLACSNCTRLLENQDAYWDMTPENFRLALKSLKGYGGIIAMIGGNPCMHPKFDELCQILLRKSQTARKGVCGLTTTSSTGRSSSRPLAPST